MSDAIVSTLQELAAVLQSQRTLGAALAGIAEAATVSVPGCDAASIAISIAGRPSTAAITAASPSSSTWSSTTSMMDRASSPSGR